MACVLTLAAMVGEEIVIGHVGDSRLYLIWQGAIRKLTADHSPVGEDEDAGELTRGGGHVPPAPQRGVPRCRFAARVRPPIADFIEIRRCRFHADAAILLCSDGLTDRLTAAQVREIVDRYDGDAARVACDLVDAANQAGGNDNVTALFVAGPEFAGRSPATRPRSPATRVRRRWRVSRPSGISGLGRVDRHVAVDGGAAMNAPARVGRYEIVRRIGKSMTDVYLATDIVENRQGRAEAGRDRPATPSIA